MSDHRKFERDYERYRRLLNEKSEILKQRLADEKLKRDAGRKEGFINHYDTLSTGRSLTSADFEQARLSILSVPASSFGGGVYQPIVEYNSGSWWDDDNYDNFWLRDKPKAKPKVKKVLKVYGCFKLIKV
jgi:hypothetical protein